MRPHPTLPLESLPPGTSETVNATVRDNKVNAAEVSFFFLTYAASLTRNDHVDRMITAGVRKRAHTLPIPAGRAHNRQRPLPSLHGATVGETATTTRSGASRRWGHS